MTKFLTELVKVKITLAQSPVSLFKPCGAKGFSLRIHLSARYLQVASVFVLFCNVVPY